MTASPSQAHLHSSQTSDAIKLSRLICICGMIYVHAWTGLTWAELTQAAGTGQGLFRWGLIELLGRSAVPLLGMISGWLVAGSVGRRGYFEFVGGKARTLIAPMVLWNAIAIVLVCGAAALGLIQAPMPTRLWWTLDELFSIASPNDINVQTPFLRDLFLCMLAAPLLVRLPRWALGLIGIGALAWTVSGVVWPVILRPAILLFFILGMTARKLGWAVKAGQAHWALTMTPYLALAALRFWLEVSGQDRLLSAPAAAGLDVLVRLAAAGFFWAIAWRLASRPAAQPLLKLETYAFLMFCDHLIFMWLVGPLIGLVIGPMGSPLYPVFLVLQPALVLASTIGLYKLLERYAPRAGALLSGGRMGRPDAPKPRPTLTPVAS